jgi:serine/threonine protein kinase/WD40 repeat protein
MPEWNPRANDIFVRAAEIDSPADRRLFVEQQCDGDAALQAQVESLLAAGGQIGSFLQRPAVAAPPRADATGAYRPLTEGPGTVIGPYKLLQHIGEGGFGAVYMAEQEHPVRRKVALKIIKPGMDTREVIARFESERQALAMMDHPNIARVFDAGATESGRPYFVMELVRGIPITEFCDRNKLPAEQRLKLFVTVCHAIQHAHHKGVIHRDVKPSNVMITLHDGVPVVKVIDFGVAKATAQKLTERTLFTAYGQMIGTPAYMSPEQAEMSGLDIDTRSDIFSLGVLLYELLTGTTPLDSVKLRKAGYAEMQRLIREEEAPRPSTRFSSLGGEATVLATNRGTDVKRLSQLLRSDLDWIVMKSLEKDRNRRYGSPANFAADIERFMTEQPVEARPPSAWYRIRKAARRNKVALTTAAVVAAALVVGTAVSIWQAVAASRAKTAALAERDEKEKARIAEAEQRAAAVKAANETKAANEKLRVAYDQQRVAQYAGDMQVLPLTWQAGNTFEARQLLEQQDADLRGFEWHYWNRQMHTAVASGTLPGLPKGRLSRDSGSSSSPAGFTGSNDWMFSGDGSRIACLTFSEGSTKPHERTLYVWDAATRKLLLPHPVAVEGLPAATDLSSWGDFSASYDGKRVAVALTCAPQVIREGPGGPQVFVSPDLNSEKSRWMIHVIDVESKKVIFKEGRKEDGEWISPSVRLSRDGRKLLGDTRRIGGAAGTNRITVWDLDSPDKKPVVIDNATRCLFSPDGSRVISYGEAITENGLAMKAWDAATGKEIPGFIRRGVLSPKGTYLARVVPQGEGDSKTRTLKLHDGTTGKEISSTPLTGALVGQMPGAPVGQTPRRGLAAEMRSVTFSPDESLVAVPHRSISGTPRMYWYIVETKTGQIRHTLEDPTPTRGPSLGTPGLNRAARYFSDNGKQFICVVDNAIHILPVTPGLPARTFRGHVGRIVAAAAASDQRLRTVESNGTLKEWDLTRRVPAPVAAVEVDRQPGRSLPFSSSISYSVSDGGGSVACLERGAGGKSDTVRVWELAGNRTTTFDAGPFKASDFPFWGRELFVSANGKRVALGRFDPRGLGGVESGKVDPENPSPPSDLTVWEWDPTTGAKKQLRHREYPRADAVRGNVAMREFSKDGTTVILSRYEKVEPLPEGRERNRVTLRTLDVDTGREGPAITIDARLTAHGCLSPDGKRYANFVRTPAADGSWNDQFTVWDLTRGTQVCAGTPTITASNPFPRAFNPASDWGAALWSPDGSRVAVLNGPGAYNSIALYDAATGKLVRTLNTSTRGSSAPNNPRIAFSPDGRRIACDLQHRSGGNAISVLDTESGKEVLSLSRSFGMASGIPIGGEVNGARLTFSPDGHRLLLFRRPPDRSTEIDGKQVRVVALRVHTWDATPLPEPKQP